MFEEFETIMHLLASRNHHLPNTEEIRGMFSLEIIKQLEQPSFLTRDSSYTLFQEELDKSLEV